jgi:hypothetical protein
MPRSPTSAPPRQRLQSRVLTPFTVLLGVTHVGLWCHGNSVVDLPHGRDVVITLGHLLRDANLQLQNLLIFWLRPLRPTCRSCIVTTCETLRLSGTCLITQERSDTIPRP